MTARLPEGLGASLDLIKRLCRVRIDVLDLIDKEVQGKVGAPLENKNAVKTTGKNFPNCFEEGKGEKPRDRSGKHLQRLREDFPRIPRKGIKRRKKSRLECEKRRI